MNVSWPVVSTYTPVPTGSPTVPTVPSVPAWCRVSLCCACSLSVLGAALLLGAHAAWPGLRTPARRLLANLAGADALSALAYLYGVARDFRGDSWDCAAQGAVSSAANSASFFLTLGIALHLYVTIVRGDVTMAGRMHVWIHVLSWLVPALCSSLALAFGHLGYDGSAVSVGWCWVRLDAAGAPLWMLLTGKLWELLAYVALPTLYLLTVCHMRRVRKDLSEYRSLLHSGRGAAPPPGEAKLVVIPLVFVLLRVWSTVRFCMALAGSPALHHPALVLLHGMGNSLQGAANCVLFVLCTPPVRQRILRALGCRPAPRTQRRPQLEETRT